MQGTALETWVLAHEPLVRLGVFASLLLLFTGLEAARPRRRRSCPRPGRWAANLGMVVAGSIAMRGVALALASATTVAVAAAARTTDFGLLNALDAPWPVAVVVAVVLLDLAIYLQHVLFHAVPVLWRLHRVHHADLDFDTTTGVRFHPLELLLSLGIKLGVVAALGPPIFAVVTFEVLLNGTALFNHSNLSLPPRLDRVLRLLVVTPDMHRVHHSVVRQETDSNFGFNLPWWDRLFGTYRAQPEGGHEGMTIGLRELRDPAHLGFLRLLALPFATGAGARPEHRETDPRRADPATVGGARHG